MFKAESSLESEHEQIFTPKIKWQTYKLYYAYKMEKRSVSSSFAHTCQNLW